MKENRIAIGLGVVAVVIATLAFLSGGHSYGNVTQSFWDSAQGYKVDGTTIIDGNGYYAALATLNAGTLRSYPNATTSVTTETLNVSDIAGYDTILLTPGGAAATKTLTFPASSTASTWLPTAGDMQETCFSNASTTAAATITYAAGTGIDLEVASTTTGGTVPTLVQQADSTVCFKFIRKTTTDIAALMTRYADGD